MAAKEVICQHSAVCSHLATVQLVRPPSWKTKLSPGTPRACKYVSWQIFACSWCSFKKFRVPGGDLTGWTVAKWLQTAECWHDTSFAATVPGTTQWGFYHHVAAPGSRSGKIATVTWVMHKRVTTHSLFHCFTVSHYFTVSHCLSSCRDDDAGGVEGGDLVEWGVLTCSALVSGTMKVFCWPPPPWRCWLVPTKFRELVVSHVWMCHVVCVDESCHACEWVMLHVCMGHVTRVDASVAELPCAVDWCRWIIENESRLTYALSVTRVAAKEPWRKSPDAMMSSHARRNDVNAMGVPGPRNRIPIVFTSFLRARLNIMTSHDLRHGSLAATLVTCHRLLEVGVTNQSKGCLYTQHPTSKKLLLWM